MTYEKAPSWAFFLFIRQDLGSGRGSPVILKKPIL